MAKGNGHGSKEDLGLLLKVKKKVKGESITCRQASSLAEEFKVTKMRIGRMLDELEVKITKCQLGCF